MSTLPRPLLKIRYATQAEEYLKSLPPEHFMEANAQGVQRKATLSSLDVIHVWRPDIQSYNELLVQFARKGQTRPGQVVPDNMIVVHDKLLKVKGSFDLPLQPARPFMMLEYVSKSSQRKDYEESFRIYERELKTPYYLIFYPDEQELTLFQHTGRKYRSVPANDEGRHPIPELEMEVGLIDGWLRFWFRGKLVPLPSELQVELDGVKAQLELARKRAEEAERQAADWKQRYEQEQSAREDLERQLAALQTRNHKPDK